MFDVLLGPLYALKPWDSEALDLGHFGEKALSVQLHVKGFVKWLRNAYEGGCGMARRQALTGLGETVGSVAITDRSPSAHADPRPLPSPPHKNCKTCAAPEVR